MSNTKQFETLKEQIHTAIADAAFGADEDGNHQLDSWKETLAELQTEFELAQAPTQRPPAIDITADLEESVKIELTEAAHAVQAAEAALARKDQQIDDLQLQVREVISEKSGIERLLVRAESNGEAHLLLARKLEKALRDLAAVELEAVDELPLADVLRKLERLVKRGTGGFSPTQPTADHAALAEATERARAASEEAIAAGVKLAEANEHIEELTNIISRYEALADPSEGPKVYDYSNGEIEKATVEELRANADLMNLQGAANRRSVEVVIENECAPLELDAFDIDASDNER